MIAADASVSVAASQRWHAFNEIARSVLRGVGPRVPAHAAIETYSVLTRSPRGLRTSPSEAVAYLAARFERPFLALPAAEHERLLETAAAKGLSGGAIYDALVGATAAHAGATLLTLDRRAVRAYEAVGVDFRLIA